MYKKENYGEQRFFLGDLVMYTYEYINSVAINSEIMEVTEEYCNELGNAYELKRDWFSAKFVEERHLRVPTQEEVDEYNNREILTLDQVVGE